MREVKEFEIDGKPLYVEIAEVDGPTDYSLVSRRRGGQDMVASMDSALSTVRPVADKLMGTMNDLAVRPSEVEVEFGIKLSAEIGAFLASATTEGHFTVKLKWAPEE
ncbi:MAG: CU044_2847 family protein [Woeseiaceae bacterium]|nr:CU044_2847 family protein [Woeseiaceae bacterium]